VTRPSEVLIVRALVVALIVAVVLFAGATTAELGPATAAEPALVIGAHYDAFSEGGDFPAADDNASGTAALLELARVLRGRG
jgi:Zn-dependent M28 family amino/carboxypeptidase